MFVLPVYSSISTVYLPRENSFILMFVCMRILTGNRDFPIFFYWEIICACLRACVLRHIVNNGLHFISVNLKLCTEHFQVAEYKRPYKRVPNSHITDSVTIKSVCPR